MRPETAEAYLDIFFVVVSAMRVVLLPLLTPWHHFRNDNKAESFFLVRRKATQPATAVMVNRGE